MVDIVFSDLRDDARLDPAKAIAKLQQLCFHGVRYLPGERRAVPEGAPRVQVALQYRGARHFSDVCFARSNGEEALCYRGVRFTPSTAVDASRPLPPVPLVYRGVRYTRAPVSPAEAPGDIPMCYRGTRYRTPGANAGPAGVPPGA